jgi:hypothetical protein
MAIRKSSNSGIPFGNTASRPASPSLGQPYFNGEEKRLELYTATGWQNIVSETPGVVSVSGNYLESVGSATLEITGTNFSTGAIASVIGTNGVEINANSTTVNSIVSASATFSGLSAANEPYDLKITNTSNLFGLLPDAIYVNQIPIWQTDAGSLGTFNEQISISLSALSATDPELTTVTYALANGSSLPSGVTLNGTTGVISGTLPDIATDTTYSFTVNASDGANTIPRSFSITSIAAVDAEILVVAGGGSGGINAGGGGGAGGYYYNSSISMTPAVAYTLTIGSGGIAGQTPAANGSNSTISGSGFTTLTALGGGGGVNSDGSGQNGGSGGGSSVNSAAGSATQPSSSTGGLGNAGGLGNGADGADRAGGGGGGAGAAGGNVQSNTSPGVGGIGVQSSITGTETYYAGGGGGACHQGVGAAGGAGGGGAGGFGNYNGPSSTVGTAGTENTGGGGGAGGGGGMNGGAGGSGVIVIAYPDSKPALTIGSGLTYNQPTRIGYRVYRFTVGSGTITF